MFHMIQTLHRNLTAILGNYAFWALLVAIAWMIQPQAAYAQASVSVSRGNDGVINEDQACTASPLVRTFNVTDSFVIGDVDFGVIVAHTWRGDLQITLESPGGTRVQLTNGDVNNNVRGRARAPRAPPISAPAPACASCRACLAARALSCAGMPPCR